MRASELDFIWSWIECLEELLILILSARFDAAVAAAKASDAAVVMVGTWSRDQNLRKSYAYGSIM